MKIRDMETSVLMMVIMLMPFFSTTGTGLQDPITPNETKPDLIIIDANVITMEPGDPRFTSIAVKDGTIVEVSNSTFSTEQQDPLIQKIDLAGRTILPGFIDSHSHWIGDRSMIPFTIDETIASALSHGWTSISEQFVNQDRLNELVQLDADDRLKLRVNAYLPINYEEQRFGEWYQAYEPHQIMSEKVRIAGVKLFMDNGLRWINRTHHFTPEELNPIVKTAHDLGYQISIHAIADTGTDMALNAIDAAQGSNSEGKFRHKIEHASILRDDQLLRIYDMNITVSAQLLWYTADWAEEIEMDFTEISNEKMISKIARWRDVIDMGIKFIGSTDTPWGIPDGIGSSVRGLFAATTRIGYNGSTPPAWMEAQKLSIEEVIRSITLDAAYSTFQENEKGSIKTGKLADFVVLSENPFEMDPEDLLDLDVEMTVIGGEVVYCNAGMELICAEVSQVSSSNSSYVSTSDTGTSTFPKSPIGFFILFGVIQILRTKKQTSIN